jgi:hypothetical protein
MGSSGSCALALSGATFQSAMDPGRPSMTAIVAGVRRGASVVSCSPCATPWMPRVVSTGTSGGSTAPQSVPAAPLRGRGKRGTHKRAS